MTDDVIATRLTALEDELERANEENAAFQKLMLEVTRDAYANQRLLLALATVWIQHQPVPLKAVDTLRVRSLEWQGDMSDESRLRLEDFLNTIELAATKQPDA